MGAGTRSNIYAMDTRIDHDRHKSGLTVLDESWCLGLVGGKDAARRPQFRVLGLCFVSLADIRTATLRKDRSEQPVACDRRCETPYAPL